MSWNEWNTNVRTRKKPETYQAETAASDNSKRYKADPSEEAARVKENAARKEGDLLAASKERELLLKIDEDREISRKYEARMKELQEAAMVKQKANAALKKDKNGQLEDVKYSKKDAKISLGRIDIPLPAKLHHWLMEDCGKILDNQVIELPRKPCVEEVLARFKKFQDAQESEVTIDEAAYYGFEELFNRSFGMCLLYRQERPQFFKVRETAVDVPASRIYGAEHLVRLLIKLPELLISCDMLDAFQSQIPTSDPSTPPTTDFIDITFFVDALTDFMQNNAKTLFNATYTKVGMEYHSFWDDE